MGTFSKWEWVGRWDKEPFETFSKHTAMWICKIGGFQKKSLSWLRRNSLWWKALCYSANVKDKSIKKINKHKSNLLKTKQDKTFGKNLKAIGHLQRKQKWQPPAHQNGSVFYQTQWQRDKTEINAVHYAIWQYSLCTWYFMYENYTENNCTSALCSHK